MLITSTEAQVESGQGPSETCEFHRHQLQIKSHRLESAIPHHRSTLGNQPIRTSHILIDLPYRQPAQRLVKLPHHSHRYKANECSLPQPVSVLLPKLFPLTLDISNGVRSQLLKLLRALPPRDIEDHIGNVILWIRAGVTNLAAEIRSSTMDMLAWALDCAGDALVSCAGGWVKTLKALIIMQGWPMESSPQAWVVDKDDFRKTGFRRKGIGQESYYAGRISGSRSS